MEATLTSEHPVIRDVGIYDINPGVKPGFELLEKQPKALLLTVEVSGAVPDRLSPIIRRITSEGTSVFFLSKHYADENGPLSKEVEYESVKKAEESGGTLLRGANVTRIVEVAEEIQREIDAGKTGKELNQAVIEKFGTPTTA